MNCTKLNLQTVATTHPLHPEATPVKVLLSGPFSKVKITTLMQDEVFHQDLVRALLVFFRDHNPFYATFDLSDDTLNADPNLAAIPRVAVHPSTYRHEKAEASQASHGTTVGYAVHYKDFDAVYTKLMGQRSVQGEALASKPAP